MEHRTLRRSRIVVTLNPKRAEKKMCTVNKKVLGGKFELGP